MLYKTLIRPRLFRQDSEEAHRKALALAQHIGKHPAQKLLAQVAFGFEDTRLEQELFGLHFNNPVGLAAGFDKGGVALPGLATLGFGFIEMGGITRHPQEGNPSPRMFRLVEDEAIINRMGFNNPGADQTATNLSESAGIPIPLGINLGKSKITPNEEATSDYAYSAFALFPFADFYVVNVSSPNTPGLRELQDKAFLQEILIRLNQMVFDLCRRARTKKPILIKIAPDLTLEAIDDLLSVCNGRVSGIVATNTTIARSGLKSAHQKETGGLSGKPVREMSNIVVRHIHKQCPHIPIIGVGGIFTAEDAWEKLLAGASLVQVYTGLVYEGPFLVKTIKRGLLRIMEREGVRSLADLHPKITRTKEPSPAHS